MSVAPAAGQKQSLRECLLIPDSECLLISDSECLLISNIHFDPFADPNLIESLAKQPVPEWGRLLTSSSDRKVSQLESDSNYVLLESCLTAAAQRCPRPAFILYPGDSFAHNWRARYEKLPCVPAAIAKRPIRVHAKEYSISCPGVSKAFSSCVDFARTRKRRCLLRRLQDRAGGQLLEDVC